MSDVDTFKKLLIEHHLIVGERTFLKDEFLIKAGDVVYFLNWIEKGSVRAFFINEKEEEQNVRFGYIGDLFTSVKSVFLNQPSDLYLQALKKTKVQLISVEKLKSIIQTNEAFSQIWINIIQYLVCQQMDREMDLLTNDPKLRYERVLERSPQLFQEISSKHIANYLRMTPETLSRVRKS
jgi:CRP-like cAMP-binding protein